MKRLAATEKVVGLNGVGGVENNKILTVHLGLYKPKNNKKI